MLRTLSAFCIITAVKSRKAHLTRHIFSRSIFQCSQKLNMNKKYYKEMYLKFHVGPSLCFRKAHLFTCSPDSSNQVSHGQTLEIYISWTSSCRPSRKQDESCSWILKETGEEGCRRSVLWAVQITLRNMRVTINTFLCLVLHILSIWFWFLPSNIFHTSFTHTTSHD